MVEYNNKTKYSFVVPVYNSDKYLKKCIDSILAQQVVKSDYEIILIDDGSKDNSSKICDSYTEKCNNIKTIHKNNEGVATARKDGVEAANGDYIICVDSDDFVDPGLLSEANDIIQGGGLDMLIYGMKRENNNGEIEKVEPYRKGYYTKNNLEQEVFPILIQRKDATYFHPSIWGTIIRRDILKGNILSDKHATIGEDQATIISCVANSQNMYVMKGCYYNYKYNGSSATKGHKAFDWMYPEVVNRHIMSKVDLSLYDFQEQFYRKVCHDLWNCAYSQFYDHKPYQTVKKEIKQHLKEKFFAQAIAKARFQGSFKAEFMMAALRSGFIPAFFAYSKMRRL